MPLYPHLEDELRLWNTSLKPLEQTMIMENKDTLATTEAASSSPASKCCSLFFLLPQFLSRASNSLVPASSSPPLSKLLHLEIGNIEDIECVPEICLRNLTSLKELKIGYCPKLKSIPLSACPSVQHLSISDCNELDLWKDENSSLWKSLKNLRRLSIDDCSRLIKLPDGIGNLTSLEELNLAYCYDLASLPEGMCRLTSLKTLNIHDCSDLLQQRCKKEIGEDWSKIAHIPRVSIYDLELTSM